MAKDDTDYTLEVPREPKIQFAKSDIEKAKTLKIEVTLKDGTKQSMTVNTKDIKTLDFILTK
jgi:hypothetical protein